MEEMADAYGLWRKDIGEAGFNVPYVPDAAAEVTGTYNVRVVDTYSAFFFSIPISRTIDRRVLYSNNPGHYHHHCRG